jgi:hypothetical protein
MLLRAALRQRTRDGATARQLLHGAHAIFHALETYDELARADAALSALEGGAQIRTLADGP